ncbi:MAG: hypothetical protein HFI70_16245 [Lachnospiraceae bacterium]|nr:hypothetical protein [Lachnospiraceae bacterium]
MANKYKLLLKMQLYGLFGINRLLHSHDKKEKNRTLIIGIAGLTMIGFLVYLSGYICSVFANAGLVQAVPTLIIVIYSLIVLLLTFLKSSGALVGLKDYDMVMSLPVSNISVILSRLTMLYIMNLIIGMIAMIPAIVVYGTNTSVSISDFFVLVITLLLTPVIPMLTALTIGIIIVAVSSKSKHNNILVLLFSTIGILLLVYVSSKLQTMDTAQIADISTMLINRFNQFYPPASFVSKALLYSDWVSFAIFILSSFIALLAFAAIVSYFFKQLNTRAFSHHVGKDFHLGDLSVSSPLIALYKKESARFFSCTIYALNSCIVIILLFAVSIMSVFYLPGMITQQLESLGVMSVLETMIPLVVSALVCICCTTSASLSLEGKSRWIMCSVPVKTITVFNSKILVNLTVILPILWVSLILLRIAFSLTVIQTIFLFITPTIYALFISVVGMLLNAKYPRYDWTSEYYAVKGGAVSVLATVGVGLVLSAVPVYLCISFRDYAQLIVIAVTIFIAAVTFMAYRFLTKIRLYI